MKKVLLLAITMTLVAACERNRYEYARPYPTDKKAASGTATDIKYTYNPDINVPPATK